jgi:hypothetical protein
MIWINKLKISSLRKSVALCLFCIVVFILTRQIPFMEYSVIMNLALMVFVLLTLAEQITPLLIKGNQYSLLLAGGMSGIFLLSLYAIAKMNEAINIFRFLIILSVLLIAYKVRPNKYYVIVFLVFTLIQALLVDAILIYLIANFNLHNYSGIRQIFRSNNWGDVYSFDGVFWYIKLRGNALLPVGLFVAYLYLSGRKRIIALMLLVPSTVVSNTAFIIATVVFLAVIVIGRIKWNYGKVVGMILVGFLLIPLIYVLTVKVFVEKEHSMSYRYEQIGVLVDDMTKTYTTTLFGTGLGNTVSVKTSKRDYTDAIYYEVQPMYMLNQLGLLPFSLYIFLHVIFSLNFIRHRELLTAYLCYVMYASSNPYIFDTTHFVVIVVLVSLKRAMNEKYIRNFGYFQPKPR